MQLWYIPERRESFTSRSAEVINQTSRSDLEISRINSALTSSNSGIKAKIYKLCVSNLVKKSQLWYIPERRESFTSRSAEVIYVTQQCRCLSMLIFRAWATCGVVSTKCKSSYWVVMVCDHTSLSCKGNLDGTTALSCLILSAALFLWGKLGSVNLENNSWCNNVQESLKVNSWVTLLQSGKFFHYC